MASPLCTRLCFVLSVLAACASRASSELECTGTGRFADSDSPYDLEPSLLSDTVHLLMTASADEARNTALCHTVCINNAFAGNQGMGPNGSRNGTADVPNNATAPNAGGAPGNNGSMNGSSVDVAPMMPGIYQPNCNQLLRYIDCRTGCVAESMGQSNCAETCSTRCRDICGSPTFCFGYDGAECGVGCNRGDCTEGCQQFSELPSSLLVPPMEAPELIRLNNQELYEAAIPSELEIFRNPSLLFRIETQPGEYVYQWMVDINYEVPDITIMEYLLDLSTFVGRTVNVSLAFVTEAGLSEYSEPTTMRLFSEVVPLSPSDVSHALVTESQEEARNIALCHISCLSYAFQDSPGSSNGSNSTNGLSAGGNSTNSSSTDPESLPEGVLPFKCNQFLKYMDCRTGCIAQSMGQTDCAATCSGRCRDICGSSTFCFGFDANLCGVGCNSNDCDSGCQQFSQFSSTLLPAPMGAPELEQMPQNIYDVLIPSEVDLYGDTSVVFRIETETGDHYYQWMVDVEIDYPVVSVVEYLLDLSAYTGQRLNVSYAFATITGISEFSADAVVQVPDQCVVVALTEAQVDISHSLDERVGFFAQYVLNVTWCLSSCAEEVKEYAITRNPDNTRCGETITETVDASTSSVLLMSRTPGNLRLSCEQTVQIQTVLVDGSIQEVRRTRFLPRVPDNPFPDVKSLGCPLTYDISLQKYHVEFTFSAPFSPAALNHIILFKIRVDSLRRLHDGLNDFSVIQASVEGGNILPSINQTVYTYTADLTPLGDFDEYYQTSVEVAWMMPFGPSRDTHCNTIDAIPPPPLPLSADDITIVSRDTLNVQQTSVDKQKVTASVSVKWERPQLQLDRESIMEYDLYLGSRPLGPTEDGRHLNLNTIPGDRLNGTITRTFEGLERSRVTLIAYIQIRSRQYPRVPSKWSEEKEFQIVVLGRPPSIQGFSVTLMDVNVEYDNGTVLLVLGGSAMWLESTPPLDDVKIKHYLLRFGQKESVETKEVTEDLRGRRFVLPDNYTLDIEFSITVTWTLLDKSSTSFPTSVPKHFQALPYPRQIAVTVRNPRLVARGPDDMLLSMEISITWEHPQLETTLSSYEIGFNTSGTPLRDFGNFGQVDPSLNVSSNSTSMIHIFTDSVTTPPSQLLVQMRSLMNNDVTLLPQWSTPINVSLNLLPPPEITSSKLLSISLTSTDVGDFAVATEVMLSWVEPEDREELESYEVWIGPRELGEFEQPGEMDGAIIEFPVNVASGSGAVNITENSTTTTGAEYSVITQNISARYSSFNDTGVIYVQIRSVGPNGFPIWSTPAITHASQPVPPPTNITVVTTETSSDSDKMVVEVEALVEWILPVIAVVGGGEGGEGGGEIPTVPEINSTMGLVVPSPTPSPPSEGVIERRRRQSDDESQSGSGMGSGGMGSGGMGSGGSDDDELILEPIGDLTGGWIYMGPDELDTFAPRPAQYVEPLKAGDVSADLKMSYSFSDDKELKLYVQIQLEAEGAFPQWSDAVEVFIPIVGDTGGVASSDDSSDDSSDVTLPVVLGVVGAVVLVVAIAIVIVIICIWHNKQQYKLVDDEGRAIDIYERSGLSALYSSKGPILDEWEISTDDVIVDELLGEGAFGEVYKGVIRGPLENPKVSAVLRQAIGVPVAIKLLKNTSAGKEKADFLAEIDMMKKIAEGYNSHIVNMVGCVTLQEPLCLITEFVPYGDLLSYLKYQRKKRSEARRREKLNQQQQTGGSTTARGDGNDDDGYELDAITQPAPYLEPPNAYSHLEPKMEEPEPAEEGEDSGRYKDLGNLEPDDLIRFAYQIASGMEYLASLKIVHRDLACRNVLVAKDKLLKITDFGLSREVQEVYVKKTRGRLPLKWMAIESIVAREFTTASDVWSFGVVLYEIGTIGGFPYPSINNEDLLRMLTQGYRLEKPDNCSAEVYDLMLCCWEEEPEDRPPFSQLRSSFSAMLQAGSADEYIDLQVNEEAPYYQFKDEEKRERDAESSDSSEGSVSSIDKQKKKKKKKTVKRKRTNPYVPTPEQGSQQQGGDSDDEGYLAMQSAESALDRPTQLGIPISQLLPSSSTAPNAEHQLTPVDETGTPLDNRTRNPYVVEPSEAVDESLVATSLPPIAEGSNGTNDVLGGSVRESALVESTHL